MPQDILPIKHKLLTSLLNVGIIRASKSGTPCSPALGAMAGQSIAQMRLLIIFPLIIILASCKDKTASTEIEVDPNTGVGLVKSINDTVMYFFNPTTQNMGFVMNLKYHKNKYYSTKISNDTIELGETFIGEVILERDSGYINLLQPTDTVVDSRQTNQYNLLLKYIPQIKGQFEFKGQVKYDSIKFPFEYKFIVVDKGTRKYKYEFVGKMRLGSDPDRKE